MSNNSIPQVPEPGNPLDPDFDTYREIVSLIPQMTVTKIGNPHHYVVAQGWRFAVDITPPDQWHDGCPFVFGESPAGRIYLVDGIAALTVVEMIAEAAAMKEARENAKQEAFLKLTEEAGLDDAAARRVVASIERQARLLQ